MDRLRAYEQMAAAGSHKQLHDGQTRSLPTRTLVAVIDHANGEHSEEMVRTANKRLSFGCARACRWQCACAEA